MSEHINPTPGVAPASALNPTQLDPEAGMISKKTAIIGGSIAAGILVVGAVVGAIVHEGNSSDNNAANTASGANMEACSTLQFTDAAADSTKYASDAFLPKNAVSSHDDVQPYETGKDGLFEAGPLGGKADKSSLAAIAAIITDRATDKSAAVDPHYSYEDHYDRNLASFNGVNGQEAAETTCRTTYNLLSQIPDFTGDWAGKGEKVTQFVALRDKATNKIIGFTAKDEVAASTMKGIEYVFRPSAKGVVAGFPSVLEDVDGRLYVKGFKAEEGAKSGEQTAAPSPTPTSAAGKTGNTGNNGGNGSTSGETTGSTGGTGSGNGSNTGNTGGNGSGTGNNSGNNGGNGSGSGKTGGGSGSGGGNGGGSGGGGNGGGGNGGPSGPGGPTGPGGGSPTPPGETSPAPTPTQTPTPTPTHSHTPTPPPTHPPTTPPPSSHTPTPSPTPSKPPIDCDPAIDVC